MDEAKRGVIAWVDAHMRELSDWHQVLWNYAEPQEKGETKIFRLKLKNSGLKKCRVQYVDPDHGSALAAWIKMGKPATPTQAQIARLIEASKLAPPAAH